jgi:hypothetical protein
MLATLLAAPPPRQVPRELMQAARRQGPSWALGLFGLLFGGFGLVFVFLFFPWHFLEDWRLAGTPTVTGRVLAVADTRISINKQRVYRYDYEYTAPGDARRRDVCYTTGRWWSAGAVVRVHYLPAQPELSCPEGARRSEGTTGSLLVLLFPAVGAGLLAWVVVARRRLRFLLERGEVGEARVESVEPTLTRINNQPLHRVTLARADATGDTRVTLRLYQPDQVQLAKDRLASKQPVFLLYDPAHPQRAVLPEALF